MNEIKQKTEPALIPEAFKVLINNKNIVVLSISEFPIKPVALLGRYFARKNNSNHQLSVDEIVEYRFNSLNKSFDAFDVDLSIRDLDKKAIDYFVDLVSKTGKFRFSEDLINDFEKLGLINNGKITRAAQLLFGNHLTTIHLGRFKTPTTIIDDTIIKLPLVIAVEEAMTFIKKNIQAEYKFTGELQRESHWQYPLQALREMLLNAIIHKNYQDGTDVIVKIFDERIEISNPGSLYGNLSIEDLQTNAYKPKHRNKLLAEAFYLMGEVEKYGTGLIRIRNWITDYKGLTFNLIEGGGSIISIIDGSNAKFIENGELNGELNNRQLIVLNKIRETPGIQLKNLVDELNIPFSTVDKYIRIFLDKNLIERRGSKKTGGYFARD